MSTTIRVGSDYEVVIGRGIVRDVPPLLGLGVQRVLIVHPESVTDVARAVIDTLDATGLRTVVATVPDAEAAKTVDVAAHLWSVLGREGFTRSDAVVAVGGGSVTDLGGFVAATWLRGVHVVHVPTTLLAMVDAAVGGKTGINTPEGKNLVGSFHPPAGVLCDLDVLASLPQADYVSGLAEVIKAGFIADPRILDLVEADPAGAVRWDGPHTAELIERAVNVKAAVVGEDLREAGLREILNYGHTFGHAVEQVEGYRRRHGEAVAIGMVYAAELASANGHLDDAQVRRHRQILSGVGLPITYAQGRWQELLTVMHRDKKTRGSTLRFVVLDDIARPTRLADPSAETLQASYRALSRDSA
ncbi:MAG: 3-dehydroquinate synthase [Nostocoides sp.]